MNRFGLLSIYLLACLLCIGVAGSVNADPLVHPPILELPNDTAVFLCKGDSICYVVAATDTDPLEELTLSLLSGPISFPTKKFDNPLTTKICFKPTSGGTYRFIWKIVDNSGRSDIDTVIYTVLFNDPPSMQDQYFSTLFCRGESVRTLQVVATDAENDILTYKLISGPGSINPESGLISYLPIATGIYTFSVLVTDLCGSDMANVFDTVEVVKPAKLDCPGDTSITICEGTKICLYGFSSTFDETTVSHGTIVNETLCFTADTSGVYVIKVIGTDKCGADTCETRVTVNKGELPSIKDQYFSGSFCSDEIKRTLQVIATDADNDVLTYELLSGPGSINSSTGLIAYTPTASGVYTFLVSVSDTCGSAIAQVFDTIVVNPKGKVDCPGDTSLMLCEGTKVCLPGFGSDFEHTTVSLGTLVDGTVCFTADTSGVYVIKLIGSNECGADTCETRVTVGKSTFTGFVCGDTANSKTLNLCSSENITVLKDCHINGDQVSVISSYGTWNAQTGNWTFYADTSGLYTTLIVATDSCGASDSLTLSQEVAINKPPRIVLPNDTTTFLCESDSICFEFFVFDSPSDIRGRIVESNIGSFKPQAAPILFPQTKFEVCFLGDTAGVYQIIITATDSCGVTDKDTVLVTVKKNRAPYITMANDFTVASCTAEKICFSATADDLDLNIQTITSNFGIFDNNSDRICFDADTNGVYTIILTATDSCEVSDQDTTKVTVTVNKPPTLSLGPDFTKDTCGLLSEICINTGIVDENIKSVTTTFGLYNPNTKQVCFIPDSSGLYVLVVRVVDDCNIAAVDTVNITIGLNHPPTVSGFNDTTLYICSPQYICLNPSIIDADNDIASVTINQGKFKDGMYCFVPYDSGTYTLILTVIDSCGNKVIDTAKVKVTTDQGMNVVVPKDTSIFLCEADTLCFPIKNIPANATIKVRGTGVWYNPATQTVCFYSSCCIQNKIYVDVTTPCGKRTFSFTVNLMTNSKPLVILPQDGAYQLCDAKEICLPAGISDLDKNISSIVVEGGTYDAYSKTIYFAPDTAGVYIIKVTATDSCGLGDSDFIRATVRINFPPVITYTPTDSIFEQCNLTQICLPVNVSDNDKNIQNITVSNGGVYNAINKTVCFNPPGIGQFCLQMVAYDSCGIADSADICFTVTAGDSVEIACPVIGTPGRSRGSVTTVIPALLCGPDSVCIPLAVTGDYSSISVTGGIYKDGEICFYADTTGEYSFTVIASGSCNSDTCQFTYPVMIEPSVFVRCPGDTAVNLCFSDTLCFPIETSVPMTYLTVLGGGYIDGANLCVPLTVTGTKIITVIAAGECGSDTCSFTVGTKLNTPPSVKVDDTTFTLCALDKLCFPVDVFDVDGNLKELTTSIGSVGKVAIENLAAQVLNEDGQPTVSTTPEYKICFTPEAYGTYNIVVTAIDSCGKTDTDTLTVTINQGDGVSIACPKLDSLSFCAPSQICLPIPITGETFDVISGFGVWENDTLCFDADTSGFYAFDLIATSGCNTDTCLIEIAIAISDSVNITCPTGDTTLVACQSPAVFTFRYSITGNPTKITITPPNAILEGGLIKLTVNQTGSYVVKVIVEGNCNIDSCFFTVNAAINTPPVLMGPEDTSLVACVLSTICLPIKAVDAENNIREIRSTLGVVDDSVICFTPSAFGDYQIILSAVDSCGERAVDTFLISVNQGDSVEINCPNSTILVSVIVPDSIRVPLTITPEGVGVIIQPDGSGYYDQNTSEVVVYVTSYGAHSYQVIASSKCDVDSCDLTIEVGEYFPPTVVCIGTTDTVLCLTEQDTLCLPVTVSGSATNVAVSPAGVYADGQVCIPVDTAGTYLVRIIASNETDADTCYSSITVTRSKPPVVDLPPSLSFALCQFGELCVPVDISQSDYDLAQITVNFGRYDSTLKSVCATFDTTGLYTIIVSVIDSCGNSSTDTSLVTVTVNTPPTVGLGADFKEFLCAVSSEICVPVNVSDDNLGTVTSNFGVYSAVKNTVCFIADTSGIYTIIVTATDTCGQSSVDSIRIDVEKNTPPSISAFKDTLLYLCKPREICLPLSVLDIDGNLASVTVNRGTIKNGTICFVPYDSGSYQFIITATDSCGAIAEHRATLRIRTDQGIALICPKDTALFLCEPDTLCFPVGGIPDDATVTVSGTGVWWDPIGQKVCFYSSCCIQNRIRVNAKSACGQTFTCSFTVNLMTNAKPLVILPQDTTVVQCAPTQICLPVGIQDIDKNLKNITVVGAVYNAQSKIVCFTPNTVGTYTITVKATDSCELYDDDKMVVRVEGNKPPTISYTPVDTVYNQCQPTQICLPVSIADSDSNLGSVTVTGGVYNATQGTVCFTPNSSGEYCVMVYANDKCGTSDTLEICVDITTGNFAEILCPANPFKEDTLCKPGLVCVPLSVTGVNYSVTVESGTWESNQLCFSADTSGVYTLKVIASAQCNSDTCIVRVPMVIEPKIEIVCPGNQNVFLCGSDTLCYPLTVLGSVTNITASAGAYIEGNNVCVPFIVSGSRSIQVIASGECGADTCAFTISATINRAPIVTLGKDSALTVCTLNQICVPLTIQDFNSNIRTITTTLGTIQGSQLCFTPTTFGTFTLIVTATDSCGASGKDTIKVTINKGASAVITCPDNLQFASLCKPDTICIIAPITPANAIVTILPAGTYNPSTGTICVYADKSGTFPIKIIASAPCGTDTCDFNLQVTLNQKPVISCPGAIDTLLCIASPTTLCFPVTVTGTGVSVTVKPFGTYSAGTVCLPISAVGTFAIKIIGTGVCGVDTCETSVTVRKDEAPSLTVPSGLSFERCPEDSTPICVDGIYGDDSRSAVTLSKTCGIGSLVLSGSDSGKICFVPDTTGIYTFCVQATDGCNVTKDTVSVTILPKDDCDVCVRFSFDYGECSPVGVRKKIALNIESNQPIGGFELLLSFDASVLSFVGASTVGTAIKDWEYFTWNLKSAGCGSSCPSGLIRFVGIADINNGAKHPPLSAFSPNGALVFIEFQIANNQNLGDQFVPVSFVWFSCADNSVSDPTGSTLYVDSRIYNPGGILLWDEFNDTVFPESNRLFGLGAPDNCFTGAGKTPPRRCIEFINGGVCIIHPDSIDARGDVNLNNLAYEIADAVLFSNYFIHGLGVFTLSVPGQIAATDVNADGSTLTVSDLTYLIRVIVGDADPVPKTDPYAENASVETETSNGQMTVSTETVGDVGGAYFVYALSENMVIESVQLTDASSQMDLMYGVENGQLRILVWNIGTARIEAGKHDLLKINYAGEADVRLDKVDIADYHGRPYVTGKTAGAVPESYTLQQNYPNPFNPTTTISFSLPVSGVWKLSIYNIRGALVRQYTGSDEAGSTNVVWDGRTEQGETSASGMYLYRLEAASFLKTMKMILLK